MLLFILKEPNPFVFKTNKVIYLNIIYYNHHYSYYCSDHNK